MPSTQQMRTMYPELIKSYNPLICDYSQTTEIEFVAAGTFGSTVWLRFHPAVAEAYRALSAVFTRWDYRFWDPAGGTVVCRPITGSWRTSLHAHGVALDINPSTNRYRIKAGLVQWGRQTDMPKDMIVAAEAIRTKGGFLVFEWGGRWNTIKDPMHFQPSRCTRAQLERGIDWATVQGTLEDEDTMKQGDRGKSVMKAQNYLNRWVTSRDIPEPVLDEDGNYGIHTANRVSLFQSWANLEPSGQIDPITIATLTSLIIEDRH